MIFFMIFGMAFADVAEIKIGRISTHIEIKKGCNIFRIRTNYQRTGVHFTTDELSNTKIQYTDVEKTCDQPCSVTSAICGELDTFESSKLTIGACTSSMFIYVKSERETTIGISAFYLKGDCDKIEETLYTKCGAMSYEKCDKCGNDCRVAECIKEETYKSPRTALTYLCLPYNTSEYEINERCIYYKEVSLGKWKSKCNDKLDISSVGAGTIIILVFIMVLFFGFVGIVTWYNFKLKSTGTQPFNPPRMCPDILFPRPRQATEARSAYRPPDISLQDLNS